MFRYVAGSGTTTELVVLQVILAAIWLANLHFHWFKIVRDRLSDAPALQAKS
jgi:hypothetical protein